MTQPGGASTRSGRKFPSFAGVSGSRQRLEDERADPDRAADRDVDRAFGRGVRAGEVDHDLVVGHRHRHLDLDQRVAVDAVVVGVVDRRPRPLREACEPRAREPLAVVEDLVDCGLERLDAELLDELLHAPLAGPARRDLRVDVADHAIRHSAVEPDQVLEVGVEDAFLVDLRAGEHEPLLEDRRGVEDVAGILLAEVEPVDLHRGEAHQPVLVEDRRRREDVERVVRAPVRVVEEDEVAGVDVVLAQVLDHLVQRVVVAAREHGEPRRLGHHPQLAVVEREAEVVDLVDDRVVRRPDEVPVHLPRAREQVVVDDLDGDRIYGFHVGSFRRMLTDHADDQLSVLADRQHVAGVDHRRRARLLDDRRPLERIGRAGASCGRTRRSRRGRRASAR